MDNGNWMRALPVEKQRWQKSFSPVAAFQGPPSPVLLWGLGMP
jgi:hypothetical protein